MTQVMAVGICLLFMVCAAGLFVCSYRAGGAVCFSKGEVAVFAGAAAAGFALCAWLLLQNQFVYHWDYGGYWVASYEGMQWLFTNPTAMLQDVYRSILQSDYNLILPVLVSLPLRLFGYSFVQYALINYICFLVPVWFVMLAILKKLVKKLDLLRGREGMLPGCIAMLQLVTFSGLYIPMLKGYIDVACLLPASLAVWLFIDFDLTKFNGQTVKRDVLLSLNLLLPFLFRRYFAYFIVGYMVGWCCCAVYRIAVSAEKKRQAALAALGNLAVIGGVALAIMMLFFRPLLLHVLTNNYAQQYAGYDTDLYTKLSLVVERIGLWFLLLGGVAIVLSLATRRLRGITGLCAVSVAVEVPLFFRVQQMDVHHVYIITLQVFLLAALAIYQLYAVLRRGAGRIVVAALLLGSSFSFLYTFFPACRPILQAGEVLWTNAYDPLRRNDLEQLHDLADYLNSITADTDRTVYTLASGRVLNASTLRSLNLPDSQPAVNNLLQTADVDLRDGFPTDFLQTSVVVTTDPIQLHLAQGTQEVVRYLAEQVMDSTSLIGRHFEKQECTFTLDDDVKVYVYVKQSEFEAEDLNGLIEYYAACYPDQQTLFADRIAAYRDAM